LKPRCDCVDALSPSQVSTAKRCLRKWAFQYIAKLPRVETPALAFGKKLHAYAEDWLLHEQPPDNTTPEGRLFLEGIPLLPRPRAPGMHVEKHLALVFEDIKWHGYKDVEIDEWRGMPCVIDHKTSADPERWGLTKATLPNDLQAALYGLHGLDGDVRWLRWLYYDKKHKSAYPVDVELLRSQLEDALGAHVPIARKILTLKSELSARPDLVAECNRLEHNPSDCGGTGRGCDFARECNLRPIPLINPKPRSKNMANALTPQQRLEKLKAATKAAQEAKATGNPTEAEEALKATETEVQAEAAAEPEPAPTKKKVAKKAEANGLSLESIVSECKRLGVRLTIEIE